jgi:pyridoxine 5-phosphate synthase
MVNLCVNIDHVATLRQARRTYEPDPVWAAAEAQLGGADGITMHLREDRRHIQDHDVESVAAVCHVKLNLEMAATDAMATIARKLKPTLAMLVPEGRQEITTEGGLDVATQVSRLTDMVQQLKSSGMSVSAFIDPDRRQIDAAAAAGFDFCEIHTGAYANLYHAAGGNLHSAELQKELGKITDGGKRIVQAGMQFNAGHGLNYSNVQPIAALPDLRELHIGHSIISRAIFVGMREAVREMKRLIELNIQKSSSPRSY